MKHGFFKKHRMVGLLLVLLGLLLAISVQAQQDKCTKGADGTTTCNFGPDTIGGQLQGPGDGPITADPPFPAKTSLIRIRQDMKEKVLQSVFEL